MPEWNVCMFRTIPWMHARNPEPDKAMPGCRGFFFGSRESTAVDYDCVERLLSCFFFYSLHCVRCCILL